MKKRQSFTQLLLVVLLFCCTAIPISLQAQNGGIKIIDIQIDRNYSEYPCKLKFNLIVNAVHLEQSTAGHFELPADMPPMYLNYTIGTTINKTEAIHNFYASWFPNPSSIPVYNWIHNVDFSLNEICQINNGMLDFKATLVQVNGEPYPLIPFAGSGKVFQCDVFEETCAFCYSECNIPLQEFAELLDDFSPACKVCTANQDPNPNPNPGNSPTVWVTDKNVFPNPFSTDLTLEYTLSGAAAVEVLIFNSQGNLVNNEGVNHDAGAQSHTYVTQSWPVGLYFITLNVDGHISHLTAIKTE